MLVYFGRMVTGGLAGGGQSFIIEEIGQFVVRFAVSLGALKYWKFCARL